MDKIVRIGPMKTTLKEINGENATEKSNSKKFLLKESGYYWCI